MKPLIIGDLIAKIPIIQGGMGVGVSRSNLAGAVSRLGGIGVISSAHVGYDEEDFEKNTLEANLRALKKHIKKAKEISKDGIIGVNIMVAGKNYEDFVKTSISAGCDLIISGAGLPLKLAKLVKKSNVKIAPIVSSKKACEVILKMWDKKDNHTADMIIVEGPKAGGHLGYTHDQIKNFNFDEEVLSIMETATKYGKKFNKEIPVVVAGGIFTKYDVKKYIDMGANGVQVGTKFVATDECDAHINYKNSYINAQKEDIEIVKSPVGLPGRAIKNDFTEKVKVENQKVTKCYDCLIPCNPKETPYCISDALIKAVKGDVENGLLFCGSNSYKVDKLYSVEDVINELTYDL